MKTVDTAAPRGTPFDRLSPSQCRLIILASLGGAPPLLYPYWHQVQTAHDRLRGPDPSLLGPHLKA